MFVFFNLLLLHFILLYFDILIIYTFVKRIDFMFLHTIICYICVYTLDLFLKLLLLLFLKYCYCICSLYHTSQLITYHTLASSDCIWGHSYNLSFGETICGAGRGRNSKRCLIKQKCLYLEGWYKVSVSLH